MTRNKAIAQATSESSIYRQGSGWVMSTYDPHAGCHQVSREVDHGLARESLADWRVDRVLTLLGLGMLAYRAYYDSGGRIADRVSAIMDTRKPYQTPRVKWSQQRGPAPPLPLLGWQTVVPMDSRGTEYADGGFDISNASTGGADMIDAGIRYICPHMIACISCQERAQYCPQCASQDSP